MLCTISFNAAASRDVVLQAWLGEQADVGREVVLKAETCAYRPLPWGVELRCFVEFHRTIDKVVGAKRGIDGNIHCHAKVAVEIP